LGWLSLYIIALLVGITRIYIGMHYPRDVLGGAVFGTFWGLLGVIINTFVQ
jgi:membrane-associated phospholipid phosphatase